MSAITGFITEEVVFRHAHMACGIGGGARGFNRATAVVGNMRARFECAGGIDIDAGAIREFERLTGTRGTVLDLFTREQYIDFHGEAPPPAWRAATPADIYAAYGPTPDVLFASFPCKGFSGLLSTKMSGTKKYQALNGLTLHGLMLVLETYKDDPIPVILFENVPRIRTRGRWLLDQIVALLRGYGYHVAETDHDCGELGNLAQSRNRFLLIARHGEKVPPFIYQPVKHRLRGVGEVIGRLPLPGDPVAGIMHRVPSLQWKTWVRLAFVPAGKDWRALNELRVEQGMLADFGIVPEMPLRDGALGVHRWTDTTGVVVGNQRSPLHGRHSVADPRPVEAVWNNEALGVRSWEDSARVVAGASRPANGAHSVADPRPTQSNQTYAQYGVIGWQENSGVVSGQALPGGGAYSVQDPRASETAIFNNTFRIIPLNGAASGVSDPRPTGSDYSSRKYKVTPYQDPSRTVIGASTTGDGAFAVADPRCTWGANSHANKLRVTDYSGPAGSVIGSDRVGSGAPTVADARREHYQTCGHYGVVPWQDAAGVVSASIAHDNGAGSVADPRPVEVEAAPATLPSPADRLVCRIVSTDDTWHRPFTTLELAALQSLIIPEEVFELDTSTGRWTVHEDFELGGTSDSTRREWIGNMVPPKAAQAVAEEIAETLLLARVGETFTLSSRQIWVSPFRMAMAVDHRQAAFELDAQ